MVTQQICNDSVSHQAMAYQQTATRANVEFLKSSGGLRAGRQIRLNYGPQLAPAQLQGRIDPALWADFMGQVQALAGRHPYMAKPGGKQYSNWILAALVGEAVDSHNDTHLSFCLCSALCTPCMACAKPCWCRCCNWPFLFQP